MAQMYDDFAGYVDVDPNSDVYKRYQAQQQSLGQPVLTTPPIPTINPDQQQAGQTTSPAPPIPPPPIPAPNTTLRGEEGANYGLGMAYQAIQGSQASPYPSYVPSQTNVPTYGDFAAYQPNEPMAQIKTPNYKLSAEVPAGDWNSVNAPNFQGMLAAPTWQNANFTPAQIQAAYQKLGYAPNYQGLMGGDYNALQQALTTPGEIAARQAYEQGQTNLANTMGGRGLYGSSIMQNQARTALDQPYIDALTTNAANAVAQRYGLQSSDLASQNQFGLNIYGQQMGENQVANQQGYNVATANQADIQQRNQLNASQNLAQNAQNTDIYGRQLEFQQNQQGLMTDVYGKQLAQQQAKNAYNQNIYGLDIGREQNVNSFNSQMAQLGLQQNVNLYNADIADATRQQAYGTDVLNYNNQRNEQLRQWQNQRNLEGFQYQLASNAYRQQQQEQAVNQALALAGQGAPLSAAQQNYNLQQQQMNSNLWGGVLNTAGTIGGMYAMNSMGLLGS